MSVPDTTIDPRILECARAEFLRNGFQKAQLKQICQEAGVTTGALYKRYRGKEDLFCALVRDAVEEISAIIRFREQSDPEALTDAQLLASWEMEDSSGQNCSMQMWFDFLYTRKDEFTLLLSCADGTCYADFISQWVERMTAGTFRYLQEAERRGMVDRPVTRKELGILLASFWTMIEAPFLRNFDREELSAHCALVNRIFNWKQILGIHMPG